MNRKLSSLGLVRLGLALALALPRLASGDESSADDTDALQVICLAEPPAAVEGESVILRAWVSTADGQPIGEPLSAKWDATEGVLAAEAMTTQWDLTKVRFEQDERAKTLIATVTVAAEKRGPVRCQVEVFVAKTSQEPPDERTVRGNVSAKHFLLSGQNEETGFGLYSYLLFSAPPEDEEERARYLKTIEAYLAALPALDEMRNNERLSKLNVTHIPLKEMPKPATPNAELAANVLAVYDYARAQALLNRLDTTYQQGPYLISVRDHPLREGAATYLLEDLTGVVPEQARNWVKFFTYLAAQNRDWSDENFRRFGLNLRNLLAVAAVVTPDMAGVLGRVIQLRWLK